MAAVEVAILLLLDFLIVALCIGAEALIEAGGVELPKPIEEDWSSAELFVGAVLIAPPIEEWLFRAGLLGNRKTLIGLAIGWIISLGLLALAPSDLLKPWYLVWLIPAGVAAGIAIGAFRAGDRSRPAQFGGSFPFLFWATSGAFALGHLANFEEPLGPAAMLLMIPYLVGGTMLAYVRVTYGMWANIAQHAAFNGLIVTLHVCWPDQFGT